MTQKDYNEFTISNPEYFFLNNFATRTNQSNNDKVRRYI